MGKYVQHKFGGKHNVTDPGRFGNFQWTNQPSFTPEILMKVLVLRCHVTLPTSRNEGQPYGTFINKNKHCVSLYLLSMRITNI